jgi:hypothetical protein
MREHGPQHGPRVRRDAEGFRCRCVRGGRAGRSSRSGPCQPGGVVVCGQREGEPRQRVETQDREVAWTEVGQVRRRPSAGNPSWAVWSRRRRSVQWATSSPSGTTKIIRGPGSRAGDGLQGHRGSPSTLAGREEAGVHRPRTGRAPRRRSARPWPWGAAREPSTTRLARRGQPADGPGRGWGSALRCRRGAAGPSWPARPGVLDGDHRHASRKPSAALITGHLLVVKGLP